VHEHKVAFEAHHPLKRVLAHSNRMLEAHNVAYCDTSSAAIGFVDDDVVAKSFESR
jgi:hypothetical protein